MSIVTLTTDFGTRDEYAGVMKGVILRINPIATLVDISHDIPAQAVGHAGAVLKAAFSWFPEGTVHLAVVDPGVGSARIILAASYAGHFFIAPDNGLLPLIWGDLSPSQVVSIENERLYIHPVSATFHGRDIMAPVAARLASGMTLDELGPRLSVDRITPAASSMPEWIGATEVVGRITGADHFGNLRTNIARSDLERLGAHCPNRTMRVVLGKHSIAGLSFTYSRHESGRLTALINSRDQLEIAVVDGSAARLIGKFDGLPVTVSCR